MKVSRNLDAAPDGVEVLLCCMVGTDQTVVLAQRHWFVEDDGMTTVRRLGWRSTWDGAEIPREWQVYAWATLTVPDPAEEVL